MLKNANRLNLNYKRTESEFGHTSLEFKDGLPVPIGIDISPEGHTVWAGYRYPYAAKGFLGNLKNIRDGMKIYIDRGKKFEYYMSELVKDLPIKKDPIPLYGGGD